MRSSPYLSDRKTGRPIAREFSNWSAGKGIDMLTDKMGYRQMAAKLGKR
jgi:hypothetical protein